MYDLTDAVLARPQIYTLEGSFVETVAFLQGYYSGLAKSKDGLPYAVYWSSFEQWLAHNITMHSRTDPFKVLREQYQSEALGKLKRYYQDFKEIDTSHQSLYQ